MKSDTEGLASGEVVIIVLGRPFALRQPSFWYEAVGVVEVFGGAVDRKGANADASLILDEFLALYAMSFVSSGITYTSW